MNSSKTSHLIWHIDRAKFAFCEVADYESWKKNPKVFFSLDLSNADDCGKSVFADPQSAATYFEVTEADGVLRISLEEEGPLVSAWVIVHARLLNGLTETRLNTWASESGGWYCGNLDLGDYEAHITQDDGGDWRFAQDE